MFSEQDISKAFNNFQPSLWSLVQIQLRALCLPSKIIIGYHILIVSLKLLLLFHTFRTLLTVPVPSEPPPPLPHLFVHIFCRMCSPLKLYPWPKQCKVNNLQCIISLSLWICLILLFTKLFHRGILKTPSRHARFFYTYPKAPHWSEALRNESMSI